jgi:hypothetical protein
LLKPLYAEKFGVRELTKSFAFSKHGDRAKEKAEAQEREWRKEYGTPTLPYRTSPHRNTTSGIPGITITSGWDRRRNKRYFYVGTNWIDPKNKRKRVKGTKFSIAKHGLEGALYRAIRTRLEGLHGKKHVKKLLVACDAFNRKSSNYEELWKMINETFIKRVLLRNENPVDK